ncbi:MAG: hypothetical protein H7832_08900 [Magnetococcus sp. DMHC-6]
MKNTVQPAFDKLEKLKPIHHLYEMILTQFGIGKPSDLESFDNNRLQRFNFYIDYYFEKFFPMEGHSSAIRRNRIAALFGL